LISKIPVYGRVKYSKHYNHKLETMILQKVFLIALAGALGTLSRYGLGSLVDSVFTSAFPWGTFTVNVLGCFLFGFVWSLAEGNMVISHQTRAIVLTGFMGAFTTFSTFIFDGGKFIKASQWMLAAGNIISQVILGTACLFIGFLVGGIL